VFPFVFVSTAFVPLETFPSWLKPFVEHNPVTIWVDTVRVLTLGDLYSAQTSPLFAHVQSLGTLLWLSVLWFAGFLVFFSFLGVRVYRRT
jgi:ABC-type multidrug transport system permease subunit